MAFDFKKEYKEFYMPKNKPSILTVPPMNYIGVRGHGDPNQEGGEYKQAIGLLYIRSFMHYRMELCLTMEIAVQKCLMQHVRMKEEFVFMEKWQINRFQLQELELNYAGGEKKW